MNLSKATQIAKVVLIVMVTATLSAGAMFTLWLRTDNQRLEEQKDLLEVRKQELEAQLQDAQAETIYLKEAALKENVFLTPRPK